MTSSLLRRVLWQGLREVGRRLRGEPDKRALSLEVALSESELQRMTPAAASVLKKALRLYHAGRERAAARHFHAARAADAGLAARLHAAAESDKAAGRHEEAIGKFLLAACLEPDNADYAARLADALYIVGEQEQALAWLRRAHGARREDAWRVKDVIMRLTPVYRSLAHLREVRESYLSGLQALSASELRIANPFGDINFTTFFLAYQGMNECASQAQLAQLLLRAAPSLAYRAPSLERRIRSSRLRVGFVSRYLGRHSVGMCYNKLIAALAARPELEVSVALLSARRAQEARELIGPAARIAVLPAHLQGVRQALSDLALDVLLFTDIGMEPSTYFLAFGRYAPAQGVLAGHPITTGIPTIDFFVSSHANEAAGAQAHYTERLECLRGLPVAIDAPPPQGAVSRAELGLPQDAHVYVCPMKLQKLHPDFDAAMAGILEADPRALVLFFEDDARTRWGAMVSRRLEGRLGEHRARVRFMPWMPFGQLLQLLSASDVVLDSFHFGAGTTAFYALASGCPVVTLPAAFLRGRHTLGYCTKIGLQECVAADADDYVRIAVRIATQSNYQRSLRQRIAARRGELIEYDSMIDEFAALLRRVSAAALG